MTTKAAADELARDEKWDGDIVVDPDYKAIVTLDDADVDRIAMRVVELLDPITAGLHKTLKLMEDANKVSDVSVVLSGQFGEDK